MKKLLLMICAMFITESAMAVSYIPSSGCFALGDYLDVNNGIKDAQISGNNFSVLLNEGFIQGTGICSTTAETSNLLGTPSSTAGQYCWCQITGINIDQSHNVFVAGSLENAGYAADLNSTANCESNCADACLGRIDGDQG